MPYFAYGTNMDARQMEQRVPGARLIGPARLDGFRLAFNVYSRSWQAGAANLELDADGHVYGVLWELVEDEMKGLDTFEGHPTFYRREEVTVDGPQGPVIAWTYRVAHQEGAFVRPSDEYLQQIYSAIRVHGLPPEALDLVDRAARPPRPSIS
jgi:gamma-glutamylcyclotransferase